MNIEADSNGTNSNHSATNYNTILQDAVKEETKVSTSKNSNSYSDIKSSKKLNYSGSPSYEYTEGELKSEKESHDKCNGFAQNISNESLDMKEEFEGSSDFSPNEKMDNIRHFEFKKEVKDNQAVLKEFKKHSEYTIDKSSIGEAFSNKSEPDVSSDSSTRKKKKKEKRRKQEKDEINTVEDVQQADDSQSELNSDTSLSRKLKKKRKNKSPESCVNFVGTDEEITHLNVLTENKKKKYSQDEILMPDCENDLIASDEIGDESARKRDKKSHKKHKKNTDRDSDYDAVSSISSTIFDEKQKRKKKKSRQGENNNVTEDWLGDSEKVALYPESKPLDDLTDKTDILTDSKKKLKKKRHHEIIDDIRNDECSSSPPKKRKKHKTHTDENNASLSEGVLVPEFVEIKRQPSWGDDYGNLDNVEIENDSVKAAKKKDKHKKKNKDNEDTSANDYSMPHKKKRTKIQNSGRVLAEDAPEDNIKHEINPEYDPQNYSEIDNLFVKKKHKKLNIKEDVDIDIPDHVDVKNISSEVSSEQELKKDKKSKKKKKHKELFNTEYNESEMSTPVSHKKRKRNSDECNTGGNTLDNMFGWKSKKEKHRLSSIDECREGGNILDKNVSGQELKKANHRISSIEDDSVVYFFTDSDSDSEWSTPSTKKNEKSVHLGDYMAAENDDYMDAEKLSKVAVKIPFIIPPLHAILTRPSKPTREQLAQIEEMNIEVKTGRFTKIEGQMIVKNWKMFCEAHDLALNPAPFISFPNNMSQEQKSNILCYLARGLDNRMLHRVHAKLKNLLHTSLMKYGRFSPKEDEFILNYMKKTSTATPYKDISEHINRPPLAIERRWKRLKSEYTAGKIAWTPEMVGRFLSNLKKVTKCETKRQLKERSITAREWRELSIALENIPILRLQRAWYGTIYPRLFAEEVDIKAMKKSIVLLLYSNKETDWKTINWKEVASNFKGFTPLNVYMIFKRMVQAHVPPSIHDNLRDCLKYLKQRFKKEKWSPSTNKFKKIVIKNGHVHYEKV